MCQLKSGIVLKDKVFIPLDYDSHEDMIKELKLDDTTKEPNFVRVEIIPRDGDIFNHNLDNWKLKVDQDCKPEWFNDKFAEAEMKKELKKWFAERFIVNDNSWQRRENQRIYVKNASVEAWGNASVLIPKDYTSGVIVKELKDFASVKDLRVNKIFVATEELRLAQFKKPKDKK